MALGGIRLKLTLAMLVATLVPLGGGWYVNYESNKERVEQNITSSLRTSSERSVQSINDWVEMNERALKTLSTIPGLTSQEIPSMKKDLESMAGQYPWLRAMFVADSSGQQLARSSNEALVNIADRKYFKEAIGGELASQLVIAKQTGKPSLLMAFPLKVADEGTGGMSLFGIVGSAIDPAPISREVVSTPVGKTGYRFIMNEDASLLAHYSAKELLKAGENAIVSYDKHPLWLSRDKLSSKNVLPFTYEGKEFVGVVEKTKLGWYVATVQETGEAYGPLIELKNQAIAALAVALVLVSGFAMVFGGTIAKPIIRLTKVAEDISQGNFSSDAELEKIKSKDEIGQLASAIKRLSSSVKIAMEAMMKG